MRRRGELVVALVLGFFAGWLFVRLVSDFPSIPSGNVLTAGTTLAVGWWVQRALRRRAELDRIPIDTINKLSGRMGDLVNQCLDSAQTAKPTDGELLRKVRLVSIEVTWLGTLVRALGAGEIEHAQLQTQYLRFKEGLTGGSTINFGEAGRFGMQMRTRCLQIQLRVCQRILDEPDAIAGL